MFLALSWKVGLASLGIFLIVLAKTKFVSLSSISAAFLLPLGKKLDPSSRRIQTLILSPTRELANQIYQEYQKLFPKTKLKAEVVCGGVSYDKQISGIKRNKPQIIIGTPGRVIDLMNQGLLRFDETRYLILDSSPFNSLVIFVLCFQITNKATTKLIKKYECINLPR